MNRRLQLIAKLVREDLYVADEYAIAEAILLRGTTRRMVPGIEFPNETKTRVRSFRRAEHARSFRLADSRRRTPLH